MHTPELCKLCARTPNVCAFFSRFEYQHVGIQNAKKSEKYFPYYTIHRVKASCVFSRVIAHKPYQNAKPTHCVIWA